MKATTRLVITVAAMFAAVHGVDDPRGRRIKPVDRLEVERNRRTAWDRITRAEHKRRRRRDKRAREENIVIVDQRHAVGAYRARLETAGRRKARRERLLVAGYVVLVIAVMAAAVLGFITPGVN